MNIEIKVDYTFFKINNGYQLSLKPEVNIWCVENIKDNWTFKIPPRTADRHQHKHKGYFRFENEQDAALFKMRWL